MTPDVDAFVVNHEKTTKDFSRSIEVDPVSMGDMLVIFHEGRSSLKVAYEMLLLVFFIFDLFFRSLFLFLCLLLRH